ncbi:MAG: MFS transporter, partial [Cyanobacteriota bacterium]
MNIFKSLEKSTINNLLVLFIAGLLFWTSLTSLLPTLPAYIEDIGGTPQEVGLVMGSFAIGLLLCRSWLGKVADVRGRKLVMLIGTAVVGLAPLGYLWVDSIPWLAAMRAFHGISIAAFTIAYSTLVVDLSPIRQRGELIGYMSLVAPIGMAVGPALGGYLQVGLGYRALFLTSASAGLLAFIGASQVRDDRRTSPLDSSKTANPPQRRFWTLLTSPRLGIPALILLLIGLVFGSLASFLPLFIREIQVEFNAGLYYTSAAIATA